MKRDVKCISYDTDAGGGATIDIFKCDCGKMMEVKTLANGETIVTYYEEEK